MTIRKSDMHCESDWDKSKGVTMEDKPTNAKESINDTFLFVFLLLGLIFSVIFNLVQHSMRNRNIVEIEEYQSKEYMLIECLDDSTQWFPMPTCRGNLGEVAKQYKGNKDDN